MSSTEATTRPAALSQEHVDYLNDLRDSGETNMFGARPYLMREFPDLTRDEAMAICVYWMSGGAA
jgi:hypothetical protein